MGRLERKLERKLSLKVSRKGSPFSRIIAVQTLGLFHQYRLHATKGWRVKKVKFLVNPNIIYRKADVVDNILAVPAPQPVDDYGGRQDGEQGS